MFIQISLFGSWEEAKKILGSSPAVRRAWDQSVLQEAHRVRGLMVQNITQGGKLAGAPFAPLSPTTIAVRRFTGFGGSKILMVSGTLRNSIVVVKQGGTIFVGARRSSGAGVNIAAVHEFGSRTFTMVMTDRQRRFLMAALRNMGAPSPGKGGGVLVIKIPARPFIMPVVAKFATPDIVSTNVRQNFVKLTHGKLGK